MTISQNELGRRLQTAREAAGLTQEAVAGNLDVSRPTISQIETGQRAVSSLELDRLAYLYGRDIRDFLAEEFTEKKDPLAALFRANANLTFSNKVQDELRRAVALAREQTELESLLEADRNLAVAFYDLPAPIKKWSAIKQGEFIADEERKRLGIGLTPIENLPELLESQGIRIRSSKLAEDISGFTMHDADTGPLIVINAYDTDERRRYSYAHEYAHVLMDRDATGTVSLQSERANLQEVRANSFAANFLLPEEGIRQFLAGLGKSKINRSRTELFDESGTVPVEVRPSPAQRIKLHDIVQLASYYCASRQAALYRLLNLRLITETEFSELWEQNEKFGREFSEAIKLPVDGKIKKEPKDRDHRLIALAIEALSREVVSTGYFRNLCILTGRSDDEIDRLLKYSRLAAQ